MKIVVTPQINPMLSPTEIKSLCEQYHLSPSKKYGQNYLVQQKPIDTMLAAGELTTEDTVVEIGPGFGVLTLPLTKQVNQVHSFEIERKLEEYWNDNAEDNLNIIWGNALKEFPKLVPTLPAQYKVLANLPYQITSNMLRTLLEAEQAPERIVVMVQKEVAQRMTAKPGDMSLLAVSVQYYGVAKIASVVTKGNFFPSPKVDSAIVQITDIKSQGTIDDTAFFRVVRAGFSNKRKQLAKNIASGLGYDKADVMGMLVDTGLSETARAEELSIDEWKQLVLGLKRLKG